MTRKQFGSPTPSFRPIGVLTCLAFGIIAILGVQPASADDDDIVNSFGFEPTPPPVGSTTFFTTGPFGSAAVPGQLEGQVNPAGEGQGGLSPGQWLRTKGGGASTAIVQSATFAPGGGNQAVKVDRAANSDQRWAVPVNHLGYPDYPSPSPPEPLQPCICITWDMMVQPSAGNGVTTFGPFFGVEAYDDDGNPVGLLGSLGVDAATRDVLYQEAGTGFLKETGSLVSYGQWNRFQIKLDYSTHDYSIYLNGGALGTIGFVDQNNVVGGLNEFSDADISTLAAAGDAASLALTGTAYFDNFLVREGSCPIIPEPSTIILVSLSLAMVSGLRRRRASS
jgi:hypothetical protein